MSTWCILYIPNPLVQVCVDIPLRPAALVHPTKPPPQQVVYQACTPHGHGLYYYMKKKQIC